MKISKLQLIVITVIALALITAIIIMNTSQPVKTELMVTKDDARIEGQKLPEVGKFELPEKEYRQEEAVKEELIPEQVIAELEADKEDKTGLTSTQQPGAETGETVSPAQEDPNKFRKKYPTPQKLREIKERGLVIY